MQACCFQDVQQVKHSQLEDPMITSPDQAIVKVDLAEAVRCAAYHHDSCMQGLVDERKKKARPV